MCYACLSPPAWATVPPVLLPAVTSCMSLVLSLPLASLAAFSYYARMRCATPRDAWACGASPAYLLSILCLPPTCCLVTRLSQTRQERRVPAAAARHLWASAIPFMAGMRARRRWRQHARRRRQDRKPVGPTSSIALPFLRCSSTLWRCAANRAQQLPLFHCAGVALPTLPIATNMV